MLVPNRNVWEARIQNLDALLTASSNGQTEVYYLATVCQVGIDPPLVSVSPNPEYPICRTIEASGRFGLSFLAHDQGGVVDRLLGFDGSEPDKLALLGLEYDRTEGGTPLFRDCLMALECRVERAWDSGDHRTFIGEAIERRVPEARRGATPRRFGGGRGGRGHWARALACRIGLIDLATAVQHWRRPPQSIEEGTREYIPAESQASAPSSGRFRAGPEIPGVCLVGCGWWGGVHALELKRQGPRIRRYFASRNRERAAEFALRFDGEDHFDGLEAALRDSRVDAVVLALPHHLHAEACISALDAGRHVLVEKPLALTVDEGEAVVRRAEDAGLCLAVAEQYRLSPLVIRARELVQGGRLGRVTLVQAGAVGSYRPPQSWKQAVETMGGGVLLDVGIHYIDVLRFLFGEPERVWAAVPPRADSALEGEDAAVAVLAFVDGPVAQLQLSWSGHRRPGAPNLELIGERGALELCFGRRELILSTPITSGHWSNRVRARLPWRVEQRLSRWLPRAHRRRIRVPGADPIGSGALIEDFRLAIIGRKAPSVPGREGLRDLRVLTAAYESIARGQAVRIEPVQR